MDCAARGACVVHECSEECYVKLDRAILLALRALFSYAVEERLEGGPGGPPPGIISDGSRSDPIPVYVAPPEGEYDEEGELPF